MDIDLSKAQKYLDWMKMELFLDANAEYARARKVRRGQVYWCHFGQNVGSEMSKEIPRPAVILQSDFYNQRAANTIVAPITHNLADSTCLIPISRQSDEEGNVVLEGKVNMSNIVCVSKARLCDYIGQLSAEDMKDLDQAAARQLDLLRYYEDQQYQLEKGNEYLQRLYKRNKELETVCREYLE
ncbi:MAG: type II toxin-antitoxin system PemK/MazF family toxin [Lachnospiraceae bacterium]